VVQEPDDRIAVTDPVAGCDARRQTSGTGNGAEAADGLIQLSRLVQSLHGRVAEDHGLTQVQARMVCILAFGSRGMAELAQCLGVERATITGLADRAEQRGLVTRSPVPGDRRAVHLVLTDSGRRAAAAFHADAVERLNWLLAPLSPTELDQFRRAMAKIVARSQANT
jgi:DNA-binding MarR family transcriptional regulator